MRDSEEALEWMASQSRSPSQDWTGWCLKAVRLSYDIPALYRSASQAWAATKDRGTGAPERGSFLWWTGGSENFGHVALATGQGTCWSTDIVTMGRIDLVNVTTISNRWGLAYKGWSRDLNGVNVMALTDSDKAWIKDAVTDAAYSGAREAVRMLARGHNAAGGAFPDDWVKTPNLSTLTGGVDTSAIAEAVAAELSRRLQT